MMDDDAVVTATAQWVQARLTDDASGHDWWHTYRVTALARHLAEQEGGDRLVIALAALLHDIADWKFSGDERASGRLAGEWLAAQGVAPDTIAHVVSIIDTLSFKSADQPPMSTLEGQIVQDADRLDAIGAIGIARTFAYGGWKGTPMHNPALPPRVGMSAEEYRAHLGTTVNHFYEKLLLLRDLMNTATARRVADERHAFMETFLDRFYREWDGAA
ncbi:MAG: HD domain-containing protein [Anaerolineae bacterium]